MLRLSVEQGLRRAEVAVVSTDDLEDALDGPMLPVHGKGGKVRVIPVSDDLASVIEAGAAGHTPGAAPTGWLFPGNDNGHLAPRRVGELCSEALPGTWTMHTLRHRFATRSFQSKKNLHAVQILLGHESLATTERYVGVDPAELREAMHGAVDSSYRRTMWAVPPDPDDCMAA
ncbi:tyrosine-type recombinase/integrase [Gordonia sp. CPCC 206044]|uniref:tyrosine-type recombinase/integrase n=1 Tax=Gordonia sp. CPCC 206044 TaxID=3140793 RepID=UPI003AF3D607